MDYKQRIEELRKKYLLPIKEIAADIGINYRTIKRVLAGQSLYPKTKYKMENYFEELDRKNLRNQKEING